MDVVVTLLYLSRHSMQYTIWASFQESLLTGKAERSHQDNMYMKCISPLYPTFILYWGIHFSYLYAKTWIKGRVTGCRFVQF